MIFLSCNRSARSRCPLTAERNTSSIESAPNGRPLRLHPAD
jgi:hypothetical protein